MTAALHFLPEAFSVAGQTIRGRNMAGQSFLRGFLRYCSAERFHLLVDRREDADLFLSEARALGRKGEVRLIGREDLVGLREAGLLFCPNPDLAAQAWPRSLFGEGSWSLCGITHTTASMRAMDALTSLVTAPLQPWDALICTSNAVRDMTRRLMEAQIDYLKDRFGITRLALPELPVIPLGIDTGEFAFDDDARRTARDALGTQVDDLVVLFAGRLSFHAKAHPLAMYQALETAAKISGRSVVLVEFGLHDNPQIEAAFAEAAHATCPGIRRVRLDGGEPSARQTAWAGADIFCSFSDNIQEAFGLTPLEAMAAGLPVVVSDWDGYRDTVRDGVDGFRVPTLMPCAGSGGDLALHHALGLDSYDRYCGRTCSLVSVDIGDAVEVFTRLFSSAALRREMGAAGRRRARENFDWRAVIPRYEALWAELAARRKAGGDIRPRAHPWPARMDPFHAFGAYPTQTLTPDTVLGLADPAAADAVARVERYRALKMVSFAGQMLPRPDEVRHVLDRAGSGPQPAARLVAELPEGRRAQVFRGLAWLAKLGVLRVLG